MSTKKVPKLTPIFFKELIRTLTANIHFDMHYIKSFQVNATLHQLL